MVNKIIERASKVEGSTEDDVRASIEEAYPDCRIANIKDLGDEWEVELTKPLNRKSKKVAEFPPAKEETESEPSESEETESEPSEEKSESGDGEKSEKKPPFGGGEKGGEEGHGGDLKSLIKQVLQEIKNLEEKAGIVDELHEKIKPHVTEIGGPELGGGPPGGGMGGPPKPPGGGMNGGPPGGMGGGPPGMGGPGAENQMGTPSVPRRPNIPGPRRPAPGGGRGLPQGFSNVNQKIAFAPIVEEDRRYSIKEAIDAFEAQYPLYRLAAIQEDLNNGRFVAKLVLK